MKKYARKERVDSDREGSGNWFYTRNGILFPFTGMFFMLGVFGCVTPGPNRVLLDDPNILVKLDVSQSSGDREYNHPGNITPTQLKTFFESFTLQSPATLLASIVGEGMAKPQHAFSEDFIKRLVPPLIQGLNRATPLEEVVFFFQESPTPPLGEITSGSLYIQEGNLHLVLANYKYVTAKPHDFRRLREEPRSVISEPYLEIVPGKGVIPVQSNTLEHLLSSVPHHFLIDQQALLTTAPHPNEPSAKVEFQPTRNPEERLRQIEILHEKGLISNEEYHTIRNEILDGL